MEVVRHHASNLDWIVCKCIFYCNNSFFNSPILQLKMILEKSNQSYSEMRVLMFVNKC